MFNKDFRPRRLRTSDTLRRMVRETRISADSLIWPIFIIEGEGICDEIPSLPGQYHYSPDMLGRAVERMRAHGVSRVLLFGLPKHKDENGSSAWDSNGVVQQGIRALRAIAPELYIITDVCMCEYTSHGHCGILCGHYVDNDKTLEVLAKTAVSHARAGADMVAPSDMMDGRVAAIRAALDENGFVNTPVMAYSAKFASTFYGPFRDAAGSAPAFGDRRSYQMDPHNGREAMRECELDVQEGADNMERLPIDGAELEQWALNGASCWEQYSNGGCSICYNADIAARVCTPSKHKRKHGGVYEPNSRETWLDVQARALHQACNRIRTICRTNGLYCKGVQ